MLRALDYASSKGVMHRDLKADNIGINHDDRKLTILDWGIAEFYHPGEILEDSVDASKYFTPELMFQEVTPHDYAVDIWTAGHIFA